MKDRTACIVSCSVCLALLGCASEQRRFTGFLREYSVLKPHPTIEGALVYWNPDIDPQKYRAAIVEPVEVHFMNPSENTKPEELAAFRRLVDDALAAAIGRHFAIATEPGPNVLRCRVQAANLQPTRSIEEPRPPWPTRAYALGTASIEADVHDSISGELVAAYVGPRGRAERHMTLFLSSPPARWEAARTAVRDRIVAWTDQAFQRVGPELAGIEPP